MADLQSGVNDVSEETALLGAGSGLDDVAPGQALL